MYITCLDVEGVLVRICRSKRNPGAEENHT